VRYIVDTNIAIAMLAQRQPVTQRVSGVPARDWGSRFLSSRSSCSGRIGRSAFERTWVTSRRSRGGSRCCQSPAQSSSDTAWSAPGLVARRIVNGDLDL
jgi:hypothetical protein